MTNKFKKSRVGPALDTVLLNHAFRSYNNYCNTTVYSVVIPKHNNNILPLTNIKHHLFFFKIR